MRMGIAEMRLLLRQLMRLLAMSWVWLNRRGCCLIIEGRTHPTKSRNALAVRLADLHGKFRNHHLPLMSLIMARLMNMDGKSSVEIKQNVTNN